VPGWGSQKRVGCRIRNVVASMDILSPNKKQENLGRRNENKLNRKGGRRTPVVWHIENVDRQKNCTGEHFYNGSMEKSMTKS